MKLNPQLSTLFTMVGLFTAATLLGGASCKDEGPCPAVELPTVAVVVACSPAATEFAATTEEGEPLTVEIRQSGDETWTECSGWVNFDGTQRAQLCVPSATAEQAQAKCYRGSGTYEVRARQGSLASEIVVANVSEGRCGPNTENIDLTLDVP